MTRVRRINVSQIEGDNANNSSTNEIRPYGEMSLYQGDNGKLELLIADGIRTNVKNKVLNKGTFYGGDADSGDSEGYDTIKLVPDEVLRRNGSDQYIIIDPTGGEPNHIHLRAGGTIDSSSTDIFLGGEKNNVRVSDVNDRVTITTDFGVDGQTRTWTFNNNGGLQLPGSSNGLLGEDEPGVVIFSDLGFAVVTNANAEISKSWIFDNQGALSLPSGASVEDTASVLAAGTIITVPLNAAGDTEDYVGSASVLEIPKNADTNQVQGGWIITFSNDVQRTVTEVVDGGSYWAVLYAEANPGLGSSTYPLTIQSADYTEASTGAITLEKGDYTWSFGSDGKITMGDGVTIDNSGPLSQGNFILTLPGITGNPQVFEFSDEAGVGAIRFPNGSYTIGNHISAPVDDTIELNTFYRQTISALATFGSTVNTLVVDISEDDDITVVNTNWEINTGTEQAPIWVSVVSVATVPGETFTIEVTGVEFTQGSTYTFRNNIEDDYTWTFRPAGTLVTPAGVILSSEYQAGNPNYRDFSIEMLEPGDAFEHRWIFRNDATLSIPGDLEFEDGTRQSTAVKQGEYVFEFDGVNTDVTLTEVNFNLLYAKTATGYLGSDTHNINLPAGTPGQRLVIVNVSNFCTLTINNSKQITVASGPAEIIYSANDDWITLYGTV